MTDQPFNILLSSAGRRFALLRIMQQALRDLELPGQVFAIDASEISAAYQASDGGVLVPRCTSPDFIPAVLKLCRELEIKLIVPTIDTELPAYSRRRDEFERGGTTVLISRPEVIEIANTKTNTHRWLVSHGFPTVKQTSVEEALADLSGWKFPLLIKPADGSASIGVRIVDSPELLRALKGGRNDIVQTIAPGREYTVDVMVDRQGRCRVAVPRQRLETRGGEVSKGMTSAEPALMELATRIAQTLPGAYGCLNIQMFLEKTSGEINVIEINPRFGGGYPLADHAGAKIARWLIEDSLGRVPAVTDWESGLLMLRYDDAVFLNRDRLRRDRP